MRSYTTSKLHCIETRCRSLILLLALFPCACAAIDAGDGAGASDAALPQYSVTGSGGRTTGPLELTRIEMNFSNGRGDITVPMNSSLGAYAVIRSNGNGLFRAAWEVDGRPLEELAFNMSFGSTLTVRTGQGTILPTFEPGPHRLSLKVREPVPAFSVPVIEYFVTGEEEKAREEARENGN